MTLMVTIPDEALIYIMQQIMNTIKRPLFSLRFRTVVKLALFFSQGKKLTSK